MTERFLVESDFDVLNVSMGSLSSRIHSLELSRNTVNAQVDDLAEDLETRISNLEQGVSVHSPYMGRLANSTVGLSINVAGITVASVGLIERVSDVVAYINNKVAPALELRGITAAS